MHHAFDSTTHLPDLWLQCLIESVLPPCCRLPPRCQMVGCTTTRCWMPVTRRACADCHLVAREEMGDSWVGSHCDNAGLAHAVDLLVRTSSPPWANSVFAVAREGPSLTLNALLTSLQPTSPPPRDTRARSCAPSHTASPAPQPLATTMQHQMHAPSARGSGAAHAATRPCGLRLPSPAVRCRATAATAAAAPLADCSVSGRSVDAPSTSPASSSRRSLLMSAAAAALLAFQEPAADAKQVGSAHHRRAALGVLGDAPMPLCVGWALAGLLQLSRTWWWWWRGQWPWDVRTTTD